LAEARAQADGLAREAAARERRLAAIASEAANWRERAANAQGHVQTLSGRREEAATELAATDDAPGEIEARRRALLNELQQAEAARSAAADRLVEAETALAQADKHARDTLAELSQARETRVRAEERVSAAAERRSEIEGRIREELGCQPADALEIAEQTEV
jgi:chromosome segregation protein